MRTIQSDGAVLCLPDRADGALYTVCCIAGEDFAGELAGIWETLPPVAVILVPPGKWEALSPFPAPALREGEPDFTPGADAVLVRAAAARGYSPLIQGVMGDGLLPLDGDASPRTLALRAGVSESYLATRFKAEVGMTLSRWLRLKRIGRAKELLEREGK